MPNILSDKLNKAPKTWKSYKDILNDHDLRNQIIKTFDLFDRNLANKKTELESEWRINPEVFYKKHLSPEDYSVLCVLCTQKFNLYKTQFGSSKTHTMSFFWKDISPIFNDQLKIKWFNINLPNSAKIELSPVDEQIKLIELFNKLSIKKIDGLIENKIVFWEKLLLDERFKNIHEINWDISIMWYTGESNMFLNQKLTDSQKEQKILDIIERLNSGDLRVTWNINISDLDFFIMKKCKKITWNINVFNKKLYDMCEEIIGDLHTARGIKYPSLKKIWGNLIFERGWNVQDKYDNDERIKEKSLSKFPNLEEVDGDLNVRWDNDMIKDISDIDKLRYVWWDLILGDISFEPELRKRIKEGKLKVKWIIEMKSWKYKYLDGEFKTPIYHSHDGSPAYEIT